MASDAFLHYSQIAGPIIGVPLLIFAALHDVAARTIPNSVPLGIVLLGVLLRQADGTLPQGLMLAGLVFVVCFACWLRGWMGGGDVKLLAAAALFVPPATVGAMVISTSLFGGVVALFYLVARAVARRSRFIPGPTPRGLLARALRAERWRLRRGAPLPYASAIAAGTMFVILTG
jgi:prepilin peptidase CpaA